MHEKEFQSKIINELKLMYPNIYLLNTSMKYTIGVPDLLLSIKSKFIGIELKMCYKAKCTIQHMFSKARRQIITLSDIENSGAKGYGLVYFPIAERVMLFRIDYQKYPICDSINFYLINNTCLHPITENPIKTYSIFKECLINQLDDMEEILEKIGE
jgi:hypothetical protein